jgi:hypothetical protein
MPTSSTAQAPESLPQTAPQAQTGQTPTTSQSPNGATETETQAPAQAGAPAGNTAFARALEDGGYFLDIGPGVTVSPDQLSARVDLSQMRQVIPGVTLRQLRYNQRNKSATVTADINIPHVRSPQGGIRFRVNSEGETSLDATLRSDLPLFKNKRLELSLDEQKQLSTTLVIEPSDLTPRNGPRNLSVTGGGTVRLAAGKLNGNVNADFVYNTLGSGSMNASFDSQGSISGGGEFSFDQAFLSGASASINIDENGNYAANLEIPFDQIQTAVPGLAVTSGSIGLTMDNGQLGGGLNDLTLNYNGLAQAILNVNIRNGLFTGSGDLNVTLPELADANGSVRFRQGLLSGSLTISSRNFPRALRVQSGSINASIAETGALSTSGIAIIDLGPAGTGELQASQAGDTYTIGATVRLENIPGLQTGEFSLQFTNNGTIEGSGELAIDESLIPGLSGRVEVRYAENLWSGETEIGYSLDNPAVSGSVTVGIEQTEDGVLVIYGNGEINAQIIPGIDGNARVELDREGDVTLHFAITQTDPFELFPEYRQEREFLNISQNIPLWAGIVVAVLRIRAGARAGVGPGQLRNSRIEGMWKVTSDEAPEMTVSTEFFMPAFVEGYVAFGAGLGLDVVLGSLTGGIEAMATAGLYGAISVVPELSYENEEWVFDGTATLAAGARLKLSLNAWAEIEALFITVWERTWELASHTMNIGPDLVLNANVSMNLTRPTPPEITFEASDVDHRGLIDSAMPEDGPAASGAREAMQNRAQWRGRSREAGRDANSVPPDLQNQAQNDPQAPAAPRRPPRRPPPANAPQANTDGPSNNNAATNTAARNGANTSGSPSANSGANSGTNSSTNAPANPRTPNSRNNSRNAARSTNTAQPTNSNQSSSPASNSGSPARGTNNSQGEQTAPPSRAVPANTPGVNNGPRHPASLGLDSLRQNPVPMPRTAAQQREDLNAAEQVLNHAIRASQTSEDLAAYFVRIRERFQLTRIAYVAVGEDTKVVLAINPEKQVFPRTVLLKGRGIQGRQTEIRQTTGRIPGSPDEVGVKMDAPVLGPDHPRGSGPRGQTTLMSKLVTDPRRPTNQKYIRGHLLNDNVGGPGSPMNLFPITGKANSDHERLVERPVKNWIDRGYWVAYTVTVRRSASRLTDADIEQNYVTADFICEAAILDMDNNRSRSNAISERIHSEKVVPAANGAQAAPVESVERYDTSAPLVNAPALRSEDVNAPRETSSRHSSVELDADLKAKLIQKISATSSDQVRAAILGVPGISGVRADLLLRFITLSAPQLQQLQPNEKGQLTRINSLAPEIMASLNGL